MDTQNTIDRKGLLVKDLVTTGIFSDSEIILHYCALEALDIRNFVIVHHDDVFNALGDKFIYNVNIRHFHLTKCSET